MENIEFSHVHLSLAREISVSQKSNILTNRIIPQISGRKHISAQTVIKGTTVPYLTLVTKNYALNNGWAKIVFLHFILQC